MALDNDASPAKRPDPTDNQRRIRLELCRAARSMDAAIKDMSADEGMKIELRNLVTVALRMSLTVNDYGVSPTLLRSF